MVRDGTRPGRLVSEAAKQDNGLGKKTDMQCVLFYLFQRAYGGASNIVRAEQGEKRATRGRVS